MCVRVRVRVRACVCVCVCCSGWMGGWLDWEIICDCPVVLKMKLWWIEKGKWIHQPNPSQVSWESCELWGQGNRRLRGPKMKGTGIEASEWTFWEDSHIWGNGRRLGWNSQTSFIYGCKDLVFPTAKGLIFLLWKYLGHNRSSLKALLRFH